MPNNCMVASALKGALMFKLSLLSRDRRPYFTGTTMCPPSMVNIMSLKGKTLLITGASRGIGLAIALRAAKDGANIAILAKTTEPHPKLEGTIYSAAEQIEKA